MFLKMTIYICLFLVSLIVVNGKWSVKTTRDGMESYNNCVNILNIPFDDVVKIEKITDPLNRRLLECVYVDMGFYTEGQGFHIGRIMEQFGGGDMIEKIVNRCVATSSNDAPADVQIIQIEECFKMEKIGGYQD